LIEPGLAQIASSEVIRDINRRIVLNLIRTRQPISRADLARASGMQRSTISLIAEELIQEAWVLEGPTVRLPRGRRPTFLRLNEAKAIIGVDIRPGQTTVALADVNGKFAAPESMPTPADPQTAVDEIVARIQNLLLSCDGRKIEGIGISLPGWYDRNTRRLVFAPNLGWRDVDLRTPVMEATGLEVELENAANACALAAVWFDGWESFRNLVVLTVSEGIGAGILINGQLACGMGGMAGEFGHVSLDPEGPLCGCGSRGCWEVFGSNRAAVRYYKELTGSTDATGAPTFLDLLARADSGDCHAAAALEKMAHQLGRGMRIIVAGLAPERIIVIGDLTRSWKRFARLLEADVANQVLPGGQSPVLIPAHEDGMARLRGTVALVLRKHFNSSRDVLL
jgi:predicted NBD/HSP70 family sugar kinase